MKTAEDKIKLLSDAVEPRRDEVGLPARICFISDAAVFGEVRRGHSARWTTVLSVFPTFTWNIVILEMTYFEGKKYK
jgi:hypothetical protein